MEKYIVTSFRPVISDGELINILRLENNSEDEDYKKATGMLHEAISCARPKFIYCTTQIQSKGKDYVVIEGHKFGSGLVRKNLDKVDQIIPYVATCGLEVETWSMKYTEMLEHFWADEIKKLILYKSMNFMKKTIQDKFFPDRDISHMSPGSLPAWPIAEQGNLFDLIGNVTDDIGVVLTDTFLMIPSKSVSGFYFSSEIHYENCQLCPISNCPNRTMEYHKD